MKRSSSSPGDPPGLSSQPRRWSLVFAVGAVGVMIGLACVMLGYTPSSMPVSMPWHRRLERDTSSPESEYVPENYEPPPVNGVYDIIKYDLSIRDPQVWRDLGKETDSDDMDRRLSAVSSSAVEVFPSGPSVAMESSNGTVMVIGSPYQKVYGNATQGAAFVYIRQSSVGWRPYQILLPSDGHPEMHFGSSITVSQEGYFITVGADHAKVNGVKRGAVYVYQFVNSTQTWTLEQKLTSGNTSAHLHTEAFGASQSITSDSTMLVVGAPAQNGTDYPGRAYIFNRTVLGSVDYYTDFSLVQTITQSTAVTSSAKLTSSSARPGFGRSVAVADDGSIVVIGDPATSKSKNGSAYILTSRNTSTRGIFAPWQRLYPEVANLYTGGQAVGPWPLFGSAVAITGSGTRVFVGQPSYTWSSSGRVHVWTQSLWAYGLSQIISGSNRYFGSSVFLTVNGRDALIGSFGSNVTMASHYQRFTYSDSYYKVDDVEADDGDSGRAFAVINSNSSWLVVGEIGTTNKFGSVYAVTTLCATDSPTRAPTQKPTRGTTSSPSKRPTTVPTTRPTQTPSTTPTQKPTSLPTQTPTSLPTTVPSQSPSRTPTTAPSQQPTSEPTLFPTRTPTSVPSTSPTKTPSTSPSTAPTQTPSTSPTALPTQTPSQSPSKTPTETPTKAPSSSPSTSPTALPTQTPTTSPTKLPTETPTKPPSQAPTTSPTALPTSSPSQRPTKEPTTSPTALPTSTPSQSPSKTPTSTPTARPTSAPSESPTKTPTSAPTQQPSKSPTTSPTPAPTGTPTVSPTKAPSSQPTPAPTKEPTTTPTTAPTQTPSTSPTKAPTEAPTTSPTQTPSESPTKTPTSQPSQSPTQTPTEAPTKLPTTIPTQVPTALPTTSPSAKPTTVPTTSPTALPTTAPSEKPSKSPSTSPTSLPTTAPSVSPTGTPTTTPSTKPTAQPTTSPTTKPSEAPTERPTKAPTSSPTALPTSAPSTSPTKLPTEAPTQKPSQAPSTSPTALPTTTPSTKPTTVPTTSPSEKPSTAPTQSPSQTPTTAPSTNPSKAPTQAPTNIPSAMPSTRPTMWPTHAPTTAPTFMGGGVNVVVKYLCKTPAPTTLAPTRTPTRVPTQAPSPTASTAVDCVLGSWTAQGSCSATCGPGTQYYTREVITWPFNGGAACGATNKTVSCSLGPCITNVTVSPSFSSQQYINKNDQIVLGVTISTLDTSVPSYSWSGTSGALASSNILTSTTNQYVVIKSGVFTSGSTYRFTISVTDSYGSATKSLNVSVNQPPQNGVVSSSPSSGQAVSTSFTITTDGWIDPEEHYPLNYTIYTKIKGASVYLKTESPVTSVSTILPLNTTSSYVRVYVDCYDSHGASTTIHGDVTVTSSVTTANAGQAVQNQTALAASLLTSGDTSDVLQALVVVSSSATVLTSSISSSAGSTTEAASIRASFLDLAGNVSAYATDPTIGAAVVSSMSSVLEMATSVPSEMSSTSVTKALSVLDSVTSNPTALASTVDTAGSSLVSTVSNLVDAGLMSKSSSSCGSSSLGTVDSVLSAVHSATTTNMAPGQTAASVSSNNLNIKSHLLSSSSSDPKASLSTPASSKVSRSMAFDIPSSWTSACGSDGLGLMSVQWASNKYSCVQSGSSANKVASNQSSSQLSFSCGSGSSTAIDKTKKVKVTVKGSSSSSRRKLTTATTQSYTCTSGDTTTKYKVTCDTEAGPYYHYVNCTGTAQTYTYTCPTAYSTYKCVAWNSTTSSWSSAGCTTTTNSTQVSSGEVSCSCSGTDLNVALVSSYYVMGEKTVAAAITTTESSTTSSSADKAGPPLGAIVGGVVGGFVALLLGGMLIYAHHTGALKKYMVKKGVAAQG